MTTDHVPSDVLASANRKATRRLLPLLMALLFVNYLDRVNVGFAAPFMNADIGMTATAYGLGVALFFTGYVLLEVPSNYMLYRVGARKWLARIAFTWGLAAAAHALVTGFGSFAVMRVLLGIAEAGLLPGILFYISLWFSGPQRIAVLGAYYVAVPLATALGGPSSNWLIHHGTNTFGLEGWRFMFAVEGLAAVVLGIVVFVALPSTPAEAKWLTSAERQALEEAGRRDARQSAENRSFLAALRSPVTIRLAGVFLLLTFPMFAISFFLPLVTAALPGSNAHAVDLVTFVPFTLGAIASWEWSRRSRTHGLRAWRFSTPAVLAGLAVLVCSYAGDSFPLLMLGISIAAIGIYAAIPIFWSVVSDSLSGPAAAAGLALINTVGSLGGFAAGYFTGWLRDLSGGYQAPFTVTALCLVLSGLLALRSAPGRWSQEARASTLERPHA
ncbi:MFS transporter [Streptomyces malaysiensis]|uniref:MFS transporter n=1 Tax=Streptomyces malaysiensis TaxID=92644 RepID=A0A7X5X1I1_STRMQ|nr:MFS transporter [Streptomyces malaysiensis]NIY64120.1 MFS transporter [Streptomyces malaysiensis]